MRKEAFAGKIPAIVACLVAVCIGFVAWIFMMMFGLRLTTGMGNIFNWGLLIAVFAFLVGFGAGGQIVAALIVLSKKQYLAPYAPVAQAIGLGCGAGAGVAILADLGSPFNIFDMLIHPNITSPLVWDMVALTAFIVIAFIGLFAIVRNWHSKQVWMVIGLIAAIALQVVEGLIFALQSSRAWWHSFIEPIDFLAVAVVCGLSIIALVAALSKREDHLDASREFAEGMFWAVIVHVALSLLEVVLLAFDQLPAAEAALNLIGCYILLYAAEILIPLIAVIVVRANLRAASGKKLAACSVLVIVGMFAHRLMLLYPALGGVTLFTKLSNQASPFWSYPASTGFLPAADETFALTQGYLPSLLEWASVLLPVGLAILIVIVALGIIKGYKEKAQ